MASLKTKEPLQRTLGASRHGSGLSTGMKTALLFGAIALVGLLIALVEPTPSLRHVQVGFLSGNERGNYYAVVDRIAAEVRRQKGQVKNLPTAGSVENIARLVAGKSRCDVHFALVQDGIDWPTDQGLQLIGRLTRPETLVFLGRDADRVTSAQDLAGARIGIGPVGSGTEQLVRQMITPFAELNFRISTQPIGEQLAMLQRGELDLGAMVIDEDAHLLEEAVRDRKLQILNMPGVESLARHFPFTRVGRIEAGHYDIVHRLPPTAKDVLRVDTLVVGNGCASRSVTQGLITAISAVYPSFVRQNHETPNLTKLPMASAARSYFDNDGPDLLGVYVPWAVDIMLTSNWIQLFFAVSVLFNAMTLWHRFRLWRIDAARVRIENDIPKLFGPGVTVGEIAAMRPSDQQRTPEARALLDSIMKQVGALAERSRRQSLSVLVPMGHEGLYRDQEALMADLLHALRSFRDRY
jgi:TRAP-type uncharacterized transport system substrate-binding protein